MSSRIDRFIGSLQFELTCFVLVLCIAALAHAYNMFHFPYYENDEGVYVSQAWSLITQAKLAPYTYWYDHAPLGWVAIAVWSVLSGGFFTFGFSINSGRVLMLILHIASSILLYLIAKKLTKSKLFSLLCILLFSLSPLAIYFQRRVLLDNIMIFWVLASICFTLYYNKKLSNIILSGLTLGIAILTKENAIFFIPLMAYFIFLTIDKKHQLFAISQWLLIIATIVSLYFAYALVKGELFPTGSVLGGTNEHVSLLETLKFQGSRTGGNIFDTQDSHFWKYFREWIKEDALLIILGIVATAVNTVVGIRNISARLLAGLSISFWFFLGRGGIVLEFYIIPLIPILALNIVFMLYLLHQTLLAFLRPRNLTHLPYIALTTIIAAMIIVFLQESSTVRGDLNLYNSDQTTPQLQAIDWIKQYRDPKDFIIIDNYAYIDLRKEPQKNYTNADWYWKIDTDKDVLQVKLKNRPDNVDYLAVTPQMEFDIAQSGLSIVGQAWSNSKPITRFWNDGWGVSIWGTQYPRRTATASWESDRRHFLSVGQVIPKTETGYIFAQDQADMLLRAVLSGDKKSFDEVNTWTHIHLQKQNGLFNSVWKEEQIVRSVSESSADTDIAYALLLAHQQWHDQAYQTAALKIINAIKQNDIVIYEGELIIASGDNSNKANEVVINPSAISPAAYRLFAQYDTTYNWNQVVQKGYTILDLCTHLPLDKTEGVLPPEACAWNKNSSSFQQAEFSPAKQTEYGPNAIRVPIRIAMDYQQSKSPQALHYLRSLRKLHLEWGAKQFISTVYKHNGDVAEDYESTRAYAAALATFAVTNPIYAQQVYDTKIAEKFYEDRDISYWEDSVNLRTQIVTWYATYLYSVLQ